MSLENKTNMSLPWGDRIDHLSPGAQSAITKGALANCPGCKLEVEVPTNINGAALHKMPGGNAYECHAGTSKWQGVEEFENQEASQ